MGTAVCEMVHSNQRRNGAIEAMFRWDTYCVELSMSYRFSPVLPWPDIKAVIMLESMWTLVSIVTSHYSIRLSKLELENFPAGSIG